MRNSRSEFRISRGHNLSLAIFESVGMAHYYHSIDKHRIPYAIIDDVVEPLDYGTKGGVNMYDLCVAFLVSLMASVTAYYICKWLEGDDDNQPED